MAKQMTIEVSQLTRCECGNLGRWAHVDDVIDGKVVALNMIMCDDRRNMLLKDGCTEDQFVLLEVESVYVRTLRAGMEAAERNRALCIGNGPRR